jgi:5-(carboxyamino)imidazole ribonucleotide mutase
VGTLAVGKAGAVNAAILAASILGLKHPEYREAVRKHRENQAQAVLETAELR